MSMGATMMDTGTKKEKLISDAAAMYMCWPCQHRMCGSAVSVGRAGSV